MKRGLLQWKKPSTPCTACGVQGMHRAEECLKLGHTAKLSKALVVEVGGGNIPQACIEFRQFRELRLIASAILSELCTEEEPKRAGKRTRGPTIRKEPSNPTAATTSFVAPAVAGIDRKDEASRTSTKYVGQRKEATD
eukprot:GHVS01104308.1.p1 GENE.GHVS01104308.1~~GHVS01104308.1.p1  ORF type:complete len:138 (+),score=22.16 GHVS01104308.1:219-632(+)